MIELLLLVLFARPDDDAVLRQFVQPFKRKADIEILLKTSAIEIH